jgi:hypothetical protein
MWRGEDVAKYEMVVRTYGDHQIRQRRADGYIDAAAAVKAYPGRHLDRFWDSESTKTTRLIIAIRMLLVSCI